MIADRDKNENLPSEWEIANIQDIAEVNPRIDKSVIKDNLTVSFVSMPAVGAANGIIDVTQKRPFSEVKKGYTSFLEGDVLFAKITPCMENGKMAVVSKLINGYGFGSTEFHVLRPKQGIDGRYLYYFVSSEIFRKNAAHHMTGAVGQKRVPSGYIKESKFPIAPLNEQKRIVAEIEKQFSRMDEAVDNLKRVKANLKRYKSAVLKAAVEGKLTEEWRKANLDVEPADKLLQRILAERRKKWEKAELAKMKGKGKKPKDDKWKKKYKEPVKPDLNGLPKLSDGWVWSNVDCLGEIVTGTTPSTKKKEYYGGDIPFFKPTELNQGYSVTSAAVYLTKVGAEKARLIPPHSVMVTCIGATIGKVGFSRVHGTTNQQLNTLIPDKRYLYSQYLFFACISPFFFKKIIDNASSTTLPIINKSKFAALPIMVPPFKEQTIIVDEIERCLSIIDEVNLAVDVCIQRAGHLCQSILKKAFSGKLVGQDNIDKPASELLR